MGWLWRQAGARLYRGEQLAAGVKIYPYEVVTKKTECREKLWDSNKEGSRKYERIDWSREGLIVGRTASRWGWLAPHVILSW